MIELGDEFSEIIPEARLISVIVVFWSKNWPNVCFRWVRTKWLGFFGKDNIIRVWAICMCVWMLLSLPKKNPILCFWLTEDMHSKQVQWQRCHNIACSWFRYYSWIIISQIVRKSKRLLIVVYLSLHMNSSHCLSIMPSNTGQKFECELTHKWNSSSYSWWIFVQYNL